MGATRESSCSGGILAAAWLCCAAWAAAWGDDWSARASPGKSARMQRSTSNFRKFAGLCEDFMGTDQSRWSHARSTLAKLLEFEQNRLPQRGRAATKSKGSPRRLGGAEFARRKP